LPCPQRFGRRVPYLWLVKKKKKRKTEYKYSRVVVVKGCRCIVRSDQPIPEDLEFE